MADQESTETSKPLGSGLISLIKVIGIISFLVIVEMVGATMLIPSAEQTEDLARKLTRAANGESDDLTPGEEDGDEALALSMKTKEVEIGAFNITRFNPETDSVLNVDFVVFGVVPEEEEALFLEEFESNQGRIKEQIVMTMHNAETTDLSSAGLGLIKRQILEKTNRILGRALLSEVVFTKINFVER